MTSIHTQAYETVLRQITRVGGARLRTLHCRGREDWAVHLTNGAEFAVQRVGGELVYRQVKSVS